MVTTRSTGCPGGTDSMKSPAPSVLARVMIGTAGIDGVHQGAGDCAHGVVFDVAVDHVPGVAAIDAADGAAQAIDAGGSDNPLGIVDGLARRRPASSPSRDTPRSPSAR